MGRALRATWLGRMAYRDAWRLQEAVATRLLAGGPERLLLLEHPPVYTIGRRGTTEHLVVGPDVLRAVGASVYRVDRGGDITYHGPGQLVGYPITSLGPDADLVGYVRALEDGLRRAGLLRRRVADAAGQNRRLGRPARRSAREDRGDRCPRVARCHDARLRAQRLD